MTQMRWAIAPLRPTTRLLESYVRETSQPRYRTINPVRG
jgi:hypothetical protein